MSDAVDGRAAIGAVLINYRCLDLIDRVLASGALAGMTVIVVDNDDDEAAAMEVAARHSVYLLRMGSNVGFARAVNAAVSDSRMDATEVTVLLNPDAEATNTDLFRLVDELQNGPWDAVAPVMVDEQGRPWVSSAGGPVTLRAVSWYFLGLSHLMPRMSGFFWTRRQVRFAYRLSPSWLCGAVLVVRNTAWERFGLLPTDELVYAEDAGWGTQATSAGAKLALIRSVEVRHPGGASGGSARWEAATGRLFVRRLGGMRGRIAVVVMRVGLRTRVRIRRLIRRG
jgi:GT2 family glycosyltransferase